MQYLKQVIYQLRFSWLLFLSGLMQDYVINHNFNRFSWLLFLSGLMPNINDKDPEYSFSWLLFLSGLMH